MALRQTFAANLKRARLERGLSQEELAHLADIDRTYVSHLERDQYNPTLGMVDRLAASLEIDPIELLKSASAAKRRSDRSTLPKKL